MRYVARQCVVSSAGVVLLVLTALYPPAAAPAGIYAGFGGGQADNRQYQETDGGYKVFGGWRFAPYFALEAAYLDLGRFGPSGQDYDFWGMAAQVVGHLPIGASGASLYAKAGLFYWYGYERQETVGRYVYSASDEETGTDLTLGAGAQFDFHRHWAVRAEWERFYDVAGGDITFVSASLLYRF